MGQNAMLITGFILTLIAFVLMVIAFASPYWIESFSQSQNRFIRCGLWEFCFDEYNFFKDYLGKIYKGCWYIFSHEYRPIWEWLSPPWFIACQIMASLSILIMFIMTCLMSMVFIGAFEGSRKAITIMSASGGMMFNGVVIAITAIIFGVKTEDRQWMPRPDQNFLSWSYAFFILSGFASIFAAMCLFVEGLRQHQSKQSVPPRPGQAYQMKPNY